MRCGWQAKDAVRLAREGGFSAKLKQKPNIFGKNFYGEVDWRRVNDLPYFSK